MEEFKEKTPELEEFFVDFEEKIEEISEHSLSYAIGKGLKWIENLQNEDGGFGLKKGAKSNIQNTSFALLALSKGGRTLDNDIVRGAIKYLEGYQDEEGWWSYEPGNISESVGITGMIVQAFQNMKMNTTNASFTKAVNFLKRSFSNSSGCWRDNEHTEFGEISVNEAAFSAISSELTTSQIQKFKTLFYSKLNADEGYGWKLRAELSDEKSDIENTGIALKLLSKLGYSKEETFVGKAIKFVIDAQLTNDGFPREKLLVKRAETAEKDVDFDATSFAISGLIACGFDPYSDIIQTSTQFLARYINTDGGWGDAPGLESDIDSTAFVVMALVETSGAAVPLTDIQQELSEAKEFLVKYIEKHSKKLTDDILDTKKINRLLWYFSIILIASLVVVIIIMLLIFGPPGGS